MQFHEFELYLNVWLMLICFDPIPLKHGVPNRNIILRFVNSLNCIVLSSIGDIRNPTFHNKMAVMIAQQNGYNDCATKWRQYWKRWYWVSPEYCTNIHLSSYNVSIFSIFAHKKIFVFISIIELFISIIILFISLLYYLWLLYIYIIPI